MEPVERNVRNVANVCGPTNIHATELAPAASTLTGTHASHCTDLTTASFRSHAQHQNLKHRYGRADCMVNVSTHSTKSVFIGADRLYYGLQRGQPLVDLGQSGDRLSPTSDFVAVILIVVIFTSSTIGPLFRARG
ncbi:uncharacterized protein J3R85_006337 [Psidium guajava]|nr:uncharacterized protein J3R85_006337 [Psidium guajava]